MIGLTVVGDLILQGQRRKTTDTGGAMAASHLFHFYFSKIQDAGDVAPYRQ